MNSIAIARMLALEENNKFLRQQAEANHKLMQQMARLLKRVADEGDLIGEECQKFLDHFAFVFVDENDLNAYEAGERAFERGQPEINPYPADDRRNRFWQMGYESGEMITELQEARERYGQS